MTHSPKIKIDPLGLLAALIGAALVLWLLSCNSTEETHKALDILDARQQNDSLQLSTGNVHYYEFMFMYNDKCVMYKTHSDSALVIPDSLLAIKGLLQSYLQVTNMMHELQHKYDSIIYKTAYLKQL